MATNGDEAANQDGEQSTDDDLRTWSTPDADSGGDVGQPASRREDLLDDGRSDAPAEQAAPPPPTGESPDRASTQPPPYVPRVQHAPPTQQQPAADWQSPGDGGSPQPGVPPQAPQPGGWTSPDQQGGGQGEATQATPPAQPPAGAPAQQWQPTEGQAPPAQSWTVPGSPPTVQQPAVSAPTPPVVGQPLGQPQQQAYGQQAGYDQQQYPQQPQYGQQYGAPAAADGPTKGGGPMAILGGLLLFLGGAALIAGSFLDWGEGAVNGQTVTLTGFENAQGELWGAPGTLAAGAALVIAALLYLASMKKGVGGLKRTLALLGSLGGLGWVAYLLVTLQLDEANAQIGLWLCLGGAVLGLLGTFLGRGRKKAAAPKA